MRRAGKFCLFPLFLLSITGCSGLKTTSGGPAGPIIVVVSPPTPTVSVFGTQAFGAMVTGSTNTGVTWQVNGVAGGSQSTGFISSSGMYVAPSGVPSKANGSGDVEVTTVTVTAVSQANNSATGSATVTIGAPNQNAQAGAVKLGSSGGNINDTNNGFCCGGTLGSLVTRNGTLYILSNNHVLAKSDSGIAGDAISQPGIIDVPTPNTCTTVGTSTVAHLSEFFNLETGPSPIVDAAIAAIVSGNVDPNGNILLLGATQTGGVPDPGAPHAGVGLAPVVGHAVAKSGRTTALTCSTILAINVMASVDYFKNCGDTVASFTGHYMDLVSVAGGGFSAGGDSGSLIVTQDTADPVALLFGGSDTDSVGNPVSDVLPVFPGAGNVTPTFVGGAAHVVIGCTLPTKPAQVVAPQVKATSVALRRAMSARDMRAPELLTTPGVQAIGVGKSYDHPGDAAILLFVGKGQSTAGLPKSLDGVRTRVLTGVDWTHKGLLNDAETAQMLGGVQDPQLVYELRSGEMERAKSVQATNMAALLKQPGILGVGITSSVDAPGESALMIYVLRGTAQDTLPAEIVGVRTRVRETSPFIAGRDNPGGASTGCKVVPAVQTGAATKP